MRPARMLRSRDPSRRASRVQEQKFPDGFPRASVSGQKHSGSSYVNGPPVWQSEVKIPSRGKGEQMFNLKKFAFAAAIALVATGAMASNFRAADQVYLPIAGHLAGGSGLFLSDVYVANTEADSVTVSMIFSTGAGGTQNKNLSTFA